MSLASFRFWSRFSASLNAHKITAAAIGRSTRSSSLLSSFIACRRCSRVPITSAAASVPYKWPRVQRSAPHLQVNAASCHRHPAWSPSQPRYGPLATSTFSRPGGWSASSPDPMIRYVNLIATVWRDRAFGSASGQWLHGRR